MAAGRFRARDLLLVPGLLSLSRVPLALVFAWLVRWPYAALAVLVVAGITDVLDGWLARRLGQVTETGVVLDGITDKLFGFGVAVALLLASELTVFQVLLLSARELGEAPLVVWYAANAPARGARAKNPAANVLGKLATALQFVAIAAVLLAVPHAGLAVAATGVAGAVAALAYWRRALRIHGNARRA